MKYKIDYGTGIAFLYTPYDCEKRFYTLAGVCAGINKRITKFDVLCIYDVSCEDFERLEFDNDIYVWREDGSRRMIKPFYESSWDTSYKRRCLYREE